jgi:hypothetical protein
MPGVGAVEATAAVATGLSILPVPMMTEMEIPIFSTGKIQGEKFMKNPASLQTTMQDKRKEGLVASFACSVEK